MTTTALSVRKETSPAPQALMRPIARPAEVLAAMADTHALIKEALRPDVDFGAIPGAGPKKVLLKPGAEKIAAAFGVRVDYDVVVAEVDHDRAVTAETRRGTVRVTGLYRYIVKASLVRPDGVVVGTGIGSCSSMESKYVTRPRDCENTVLKMASKRALVAAVLGTFGLSEAFTQDVGDDEDDEDVRVSEARAAQPPPAATKRADEGAVLSLAEKICAASDGEALAALHDQVGDVAGGDVKRSFALQALVQQRSAQLADQAWDGNEREQKAVAWLRAQMEARTTTMAQAA